MADDDSDDSRGGNAGVASAFQAGFSKGKQKKASTPKPPGGGAKAGASDVRFQIGQAGVSGAPTIGDLSKTLWANPPSNKRGGRIKRTGLALLHKNEFVIPAKHRSAKALHKRTITKG